MDVLKIKKAYVISFLAVWFVLWANFILRDLYKHGMLREYRALFLCDYEDKHAYTYGENYYRLLKLAKDNMPEKGRYRFEGVEDLSLDSRRGIYYLYPLLKRDDADYVLVYDVPGYQRGGFGIFKRLDEERFILKRY